MFVCNGVNMKLSLLSLDSRITSGSHFFHNKSLSNFKSLIVPSLQDPVRLQKKFLLEGSTEINSNDSISALSEFRNKNRKNASIPVRTTKTNFSNNDENESFESNSMERKIFLRSFLIAKQVVSKLDGSILGVVTQLYVDFKTWNVVALQVKSNFVFGQTYFFPLQNIVQIGDVLLVDDFSAIHNRFSSSECTTLIGYDVVNESDYFFGKVRDYFFFPENGRIFSIIFDSVGIPLIPANILSTFEFSTKEILNPIFEEFFFREIQILPIKNNTSQKMKQLTRGFLDSLLFNENFENYSKKEIFRSKNNSKLKKNLKFKTDSYENGYFEDKDIEMKFSKNGKFDFNEYGVNEERKMGMDDLGMKMKKMKNFDSKKQLKNTKNDYDYFFNNDDDVMREEENVYQKEAMVKKSQTEKLKMENDFDFENEKFLKDENLNFLKKNKDRKVLDVPEKKFFLQKKQEALFMENKDLFPEEDKKKIFKFNDENDDEDELGFVVSAQLLKEKKKEKVLRQENVFSEEKFPDSKNDKTVFDFNENQTYSGKSYENSRNSTYSRQSSLGEVVKNDEEGLILTRKNQELKKNVGQPKTFFEKIVESNRKPMDFI